TSSAAATTTGPGPTSRTDPASDPPRAPEVRAVNPGRERTAIRCPPSPVSFRSAPVCSRLPLCGGRRVLPQGGGRGYADVLEDRNDLRDNLKEEERDRHYDTLCTQTDRIDDPDHPHHVSSDLLGHGSGRRRSGNDHPAGKRHCGTAGGAEGGDGAQRPLPGAVPPLHGRSGHRRYG